MSEGNVQLKLRVNLDLVAFRKDLGKLAQAAAAYYYPINLQVNKRNFTRQLENIGRTLGTRKYNVNVDDTSIKAASIQVDRLAEKLKRLSGTININTNIGEAGGRPGTAMAVMARKLANQFKGDIDAAARQMQAIRGEGPFGKGTRSIPGFKAAAQGMGIENAFKLFFQELKTVDPRRLAKALDDGSVMMMQGNREIKQSLDAIQDKAKKLASDLSAMGDAAKTTGKASIERAGKALYPQNYGLKIASLLSSVEKLNSDLRKVSAASGVELSDPLNELSSVLRGLSNSFVNIAGFNRTLDETLRGFDTATKRATQATAAYAERIQRRAGTAPAQATAGPRLLSGQAPAGALAIPSREDPYRVIETQVRNAFDIIEDYHKRQAESFANNYKKVIENYHRRTLSSIVRSMQVTDLGGRGRPLLPSGRDPLMLPGAGGTTPIGQMRFNAVTTGVNPPLALPPGRDRVLGQPPFMTAPSIGAPITRRPMGMTGSAPLRGPAGGGAAETGVVDAAKKTLQFKTAMDVAAESTKNLTASQIPLLGGIKNLAAEFGQAAKQVLLYGTAYKGLAFITSLPGQIFNAAKAQQQYNNSLQVVTESTGTYAKELLYVDQIQRTFGLDLQATRKGFTDLYASMAPTGFDSGSIEKLFTGISAASAALQLTPATMDRVIYAFAQMASKGQIMSEELKRQLGDALPGALGIFANAAGMSLQEFNKAMEAGEFTGNKFRETIAKVTDELIDRFGSGAQAAGKSLQGLTNIIKGDFIRTLEALTPLVNSVAQATLTPLGNVLKQFSSATRVAMGEMSRLEQQIEKQKQLIGELEVEGVDTDQIKKARVALLALQADYEKLNIAMEDPATKRQAEQIKQFVAELSRLGQVALNIAGAIGSVLNPVMTFFGLNLSTLVGTIAAVAISFNMLKLSITIIMGVAVALKNLQIALASTQKSLMLLQFGFKMLGVKISMAQLKLIGFGAVLKGLLIASGVGAVLVGLGLLAAAFGNIGNSAKRAAEDAKASIQSIKEAAAGGNVALIEMQSTKAKLDIAGLKALSEEFKAQESVTAATVERRRVVEVSKEQAARAQVFGLDLKVGKINQAVLNRNIAAAQKAKQDLEREANLAMGPAVARRAALGLEDPNLGVVPEEADGDEGARQKALDQAQRDAERLASQQQQLTIANAELENKKNEFTFATRSQLLDDEFEQRKSLVDSFYDYEIAGANEIIGVRLKLEKQLASIRMGAMKTYQDSLRRMEEGRLKIALAERTRTAATAASQIEPSGGAAATGGAIFGDTGRTFNAQGWVHGHFQNMNREALVADTVETVMALLSQGVPTELGSGEKFTQGMSQQQIEEIVRRGIASHKKYESGIGAVDIFVPEGTSVPVPVSGVSNMGGSAGVGGNLARGTQLMHLDPRSTSGGALSGTAFSMARREQKTELSVEAAEAEQAELARRLLSTTETEFSKARDAARVAVAEMLGTVMPVEQLKLENQLLEERGRLMLQSIPEEVIQMEEDRFKAMAKGQQIQSALKTEIEFYEFALDAANKAIKAGGPDLEQYEQLAKQLQKTINGLKGELDGIEPAFNAFNVELAKSTLQALQNADALKAMQETVETIEQAVEGAMSAYKGFAAEVISGGSLKDAASKMQQALKDQAVTMFLDFALKPMEQFMEDGLKKMFGIPSEDEKRKEQIAKLQEQINATKLNTDAINANTAAQGGQAPTSPTANVPGVGNTPTSSLFSMGGLGSQAVNAPMAIDIAAFGGASSAIDSLNESVYSMGSAIPSFKDSLGNITDTVYKASEETNAQGATFSENLGKAVGAIGIAATSVMGIAAGISQIKEGGASNVLGGIGSVLMGIGGAMGGFGKLFPGKAAANGAVWQGGFTAFANGGVVNGPTLGLVGEGKYNEAIVPLPDGRSIPVKMAGGSSARSIMEDNGRSGSSSPSTLSLSFETTKINGVEYVSRDQLELAMAATRKEATREGATRGMNMTIDKIKNSPSTRNSLGIGRR
jgi:tape measure domain-containing protein